MYVQLNADNNSGYDFSYWSGSASGSSNPTSMYVPCPGSASATANYGLYNDNNAGWSCNRQILANEPDGNFDNCPYKIVGCYECTNGGYVETNPQSSGDGLELQVDLPNIEYNQQSNPNPAGYASASTQLGFGLTNVNAQSFVNDNVWSNVSYTVDQSGQWVDFTYDFFLSSGGNSYEIMVMPFASEYMDAVCAAEYLTGYAFETYSNIPTYLNGNEISMGYWEGCYGSPSTYAGRWIAQFVPCIYLTCGDNTWISNGLLAIDLSAVVSDAMSEFGLNPSSTTVGAIYVGSEYGAYYSWWSIDIISVSETVYLYSWTLSYSGTTYTMVN